MNENELKLLRKIIVPASDGDNLPFNVSRLEKIIKEKIPETLEKNAPPNFPKLYFEFEYVYSKFYDFLLFNQLIGKKIVALGGGFSSGKSTFLNTLFGKARILPTDINPSTSVPTYVISGDTEKAGAVNTFSARIEMELTDVRTIAHGFGEDDDATNSVTLGHLLRSIFVSIPQQCYANIAFLDTPGYSKPDSENYSAKTDEKIARSQLNASDYILWFISSESGTISFDDLNFLSDLEKDIPKLIILNKVDKVVNPEDLQTMKENVQSALALKGIKYEDVLTYSRRDDVECDRVKIREVLSQLNEKQIESDFAYSFKKLFVACKNYYDEVLNNYRVQLSRLNKISTFVGGDLDIQEYMSDLISNSDEHIKTLKNLENGLHDLQQEFFTEIKSIADKVNIKMPEPSEIDLLEDRISDPTNTVKNIFYQQGLSLDIAFCQHIGQKLREFLVADTLNEAIHCADKEYQMIKQQANKYKLRRHALINSNIKEDYLILLLSCLTYSEDRDNGILHILKVAVGSGYDEDVLNLQSQAMILEENRVSEIISMIRDEDLVNAFLIDCLYLAKILGDNKKICEYISSLFTLLNIDKAVIEEGLILVKILFEDDWEKYIYTIGCLEQFTKKLTTITSREPAKTICRTDIR